MTFSELNPSVSDFLAMKKHLEGQWSHIQDTWKKVDSFVDGSYQVWTSDQMRARRTNHKSPRAANIIRHAVNAQTAYSPRVHREPLGTGQDEREAADALEEGLVAALIAVGRKNPTVPWKQAYRYLFQYDYCAVRVGADLRDWDALEPQKTDFRDTKLFELRRRQWEREKLHHNPLTLDVPHPSRVLMDPSEKNPNTAIITFTMEAQRVRDLVINKLNKRRAGKVFPTPSNPHEQVEIDEFWSTEWHKVFHGGDLLYEEQNTWGFTPLFHAFGGHGAEGPGREGMKPDFLARPLLKPTLDLLLLETQQMNARHEVLIRAAYALLRSSRDATQLAEAMAEESIVEDVEEGDVGFIPYPQLPGWLFQEAQQNERDIQEATYPSGVFGVKQPGVVTVGQEAILQERADNTFNDTRAQVEDLATHAAQGYLRLIDVLTFGGHIEPNGVRFGKHRIKSSQIDGDYNATVSFELVDPVLLLQERQQALAEVQQNLMSRRRYWQIARVENASEEQENLLEDEINKDPRVHAILVERIMRAMGLEELADEMAKRREMGEFDAVPTDERGNRDLIADLARMDGNGVGVQRPGSPGEAAAAVRQLRQPIGGVEGAAVRPDQRR